jgi:uncharacterized protein (DUF924 family)
LISYHWIQQRPIANWSAHEAAARGDLNHWPETSDGAPALLLLDQFPRNAFRSTPRMYASDAATRRWQVYF